MPGVARAGLQTPLASIVPSLHLSLFGLRPPLYSLKHCAHCALFYFHSLQPQNQPKGATAKSRKTRSRGNGYLKFIRLPHFWVAA
jgi:hypothetical protein